jgi:hypothetical protein
MKLLIGLNWLGINAEPSVFPNSTETLLQLKELHTVQERLGTIN